jgi:hypothetical protein
MKANSFSRRRPGLADAPHPQLARGVRQVALAGLALVLVWPAARGYSSWLGWLPLWLLGMPMMAWWALYRFPLPHLPKRDRSSRRRRRGPQARRIGRVAGRGLSQAA